MKKDLSKEVNELNKRISELEKMLSTIIQPIRQVTSITQNYLRIVNILIEKGGLPPEVILTDVKDSISKEIIRTLMEKNEQNISEITERVRTKRGTSSRRIIRERLKTLEEKNLVQKTMKGQRYVYSLTEKVIKKWSQLLGFNI